MKISILISGVPIRMFGLLSKDDSWTPPKNFVQRLAPNASRRSWRVLTRVSLAQFPTGKGQANPPRGNFNYAIPNW